MSKKTKKRNKQYQGEDAKTPTSQGPTVTRYKAVVRSPLGEWWHDHKRTVKLSAGIGGGLIIVVWLLIEAVNLIF